MGSDLLAGQAAATLMLIESGGDVKPWRTMTHKLLA